MNMASTARRTWQSIIGAAGACAAVAGGNVLTLTVDDVRATDAWLRSKGIRCDEVQEIPGVVTISAFYDPEGNPIQFGSAAPPPA